MAVSPVILQATSKHTASIIFLHGLGDTGHGWAQAMAQIRPAYMKVICPTAPTMPVTLNAGFEMPSWFDLKTLDMYGPEDEVGIKKATTNIQTMIQSEISAGIPPNRIIIGGFSQGGALALHTGLTSTQALGGIVALSCWLPLHKSFPDARKTADTVPIFQCHGEVDPVVPYKFGQLSHYSLKTFMKNAQFSSYPGLSHSSSQQEMDDIKDFIEKHVPPQ
ncbi:acyl-protein thioesterase 1 [Sitodiplosis mosellana]|uniref:acyl-protein thioesterase 1 n=1 Tax=Sitodiplosis mosellana TaxID=263140 RepID=UPI002443ED9C|nr:acyl-protein thioesterase 1 [Sitodiplosis mosellana]